MFTCTYLYKLQNSPAVPAPGCSLCLDPRAAGTELARGPGSGCGPSPPTLSISRTTALKQGWEKGTEYIRAGAKRPRRAWTAFLAVSEDSLLSGYCLKNNICSVVSGSGRWGEAKPVSQAEGCLCVRCLADWAGAVTLSSMFLSSVQPHFYLWQHRNVPFPPRKAKLDAWSKGGQPVWSWLQEERKGNFPKGFD